MFGESAARGEGMAGKLVHFEVPADDTTRAREFYNGLFGWSFQTMEGPVEYHMAQVSEGLGAGLHRADQGGGIPGIFVYFDVDDIREGAQRVRELGGDVEEPGPVPGMGWFARCADTEGNRFGLWQNDPSAPAGS
jgi:predicted enzyme related to lactoylglutathione lyase